MKKICLVCKIIVAIAEIDTPSDGQHICFKKVESLQYPIDYATFKDAPELKNMEFIQNKNGSLFKVAPDEYEYLMDLIREYNPIEANKLLQSYTQEDFLNEVFMSEENYTKLRSLLQNKKNIILQGAPGVGKTFSAKRLAYSMMGESDYKSRSLWTSQTRKHQKSPKDKAKESHAFLLQC